MPELIGLRACKKINMSFVRLLAGSALITMLLLPSHAWAQSADKEVVDIGYPSVKAALAALTEKPGVNMQEHDGWIVITDQSDDEFVIWSFPPETHRSYPTAVRRQIVSRDGESRIEMTILCQTLAEVECDIIFEQFREMNSALVSKLQSKS